MKNSKKRELILACCMLAVCVSCNRHESEGNPYIQFDNVEKGEKSSTYVEVESGSDTDYFKLTVATVLKETTSTVTTTTASVQQDTEQVAQTAYVVDVNSHKGVSVTAGTTARQSMIENQPTDVVDEGPGLSTSELQPDTQVQTEINGTIDMIENTTATKNGRLPLGTDVVINGSVESTSATTENQTEPGSEMSESTSSNVTITDLPGEDGKLPNSIQECISMYEQDYPGIDIAVGVFSLDGSIAMTYNETMEISGACTVKSAYAMYVLCECEVRDIDIYTKELEYKENMRNEGSGEIKYRPYGTTFTISYLLEVLLGISDNTAYNILLQEFSLDGFQTFLNNIGGQNLRNLQYGSVTVMQRKNEWLSIYNYFNSDSRYSEVLRQDLTNTSYCYLVEWMSQCHNYTHKSGWCNDRSYTSASDCAIIDNKYLIVVLTQDYSTGRAHTDVVKGLGVAIENYMNNRL